MISAVSHTGIAEKRGGPQNVSSTSAERISSLSASGSSIAPSSLHWLKRRATQPSIPSLTDATTNAPIAAQ